jgi:menaquinol-cytochrome c reductase iron-sulfur subunit
MSETKKKTVTRRDFMKGAIASIMAFIAAGIGIPALAYIAGPALKKKATQNWVRLGSISKIPVGEPTLFNFKFTVQTGWIVDEQEATVYVITDNGRDFVALSNVCTHLGCRVRWLADKNSFFCPCHNGQFDKDGNVLGGPPPRPLDKYELKVENDQLYVLGG